MMTPEEELRKLRIESSELRKKYAKYFNLWDYYKNKIERFKRKVTELQEKNKALKEENRSLKEQLNKEKETKEKYRGMIFKSSKKQEKPQDGKSRGAQIGHKGVSRKNPERIDRKKEVSLTHCPNCQNSLSSSNRLYERIVEDIAFSLQTIITKYTIQKQWCAVCKKEVRAVPEGTIKHSPFGLNILLWTLVQKYHLRLPLNRIVSSFKIQYNLKITEGSIQNLLSLARKQFGKKYDELIDEVKSGKVKHADETGWRIQGQNAWVWMFSSEKAIFYTIEETRGKGVPQKVLGKDPPGVLVRDDYGAYKHLNLPQQSCWAHLLRVSKEKTKLDTVSEEMEELHKKLKKMYGELSEIIQGENTLKEKDRKCLHKRYEKEIRKIVDFPFSFEDAKAIQTRIRNQGNNLITAIKYPNVPLTNNEAERNIRKMVVTRKISGGSQSTDGAKIHAVNMSVVQSILKQEKSLIEELRFLFSSPSWQGVSEKGE
jgi:transposase